MWESRKKKKVEPLSLAEALHFSEDELDLNREGQLSDRQRDELLSIAHQIKSLELLVYLISPIVILFVILDGIRLGDTLSSRAVMLGVVGLTAYGIVAVVNRYMAHYQFDAEDDIVSAVQGHILLDIRRQSRNSAVYVVRVSGEAFNVGKEVFFAFKNGDPYALYYVSRTRRLLSAEALRQE